VTSSVAEPRGLVTVGPYAALSLRYRVTTSNVDLATDFDRLYRSCATSNVDDEPGSMTAIEVRDDAAPGSVRVGDEAAVDVRDREDLLPTAMTEIDRASVAASADEFVLLHASAVLGADGPVLLVGPSGAGKSTLSAALATRGWTYLGDEVIGLDEHATQAFANPKPWKLDRASRAALGDLGGGAGLGDDLSDREVLVAPHDVGAVHAPGPAGPPSAIVRVAFCAGADAVVSPLSRADGAELLADQCFNFARWGARALDTVVALARRAPALHLDFGDLRSAVDALEAALR
jgi:hypothetical protein